MVGRKKIPCCIMRGGTSKGVYFLEKDIPEAGPKRDQFLLQIMGSPDLKQINGLGGAASVTSKVAIVRPSLRSDADVDYTFAQVAVDKPLVSYKGNCGNISSGVGPFAIERGIVPIQGKTTEVRIFNTNTERIIVEEIQTSHGRVQYEGNCRIAGVPGSAAPVKMSFLKPEGTLGKGLLPTGKASEILDVPEYGEIEASIIDAANPLVFVNAKDLGLSGTKLEENRKMLDLLERIRAAAAVRLGLIEDYRSSSWASPGIPKMTLVAEAKDYTASDGSRILKKDIDILGRMMSMQKPHPTYALTGAMCTAAAAAVPGSVVSRLLPAHVTLRTLRIGHPGGILKVGIDYGMEENKIVIYSTSANRTANMLMDGFCFFREDEKVCN